MKITGKQIHALLAKLIHSDTEYYFDKDYYWVIPSDTLYDPEVQPKELTRGQLSDDISEVEESLKSGDEPVLFHDLAHLSHILRAIADSDMDKS